MEDLHRRALKTLTHASAQNAVQECCVFWLPPLRAL
jgi:hypothetical protein